MYSSKNLKQLVDDNNFILDFLNAILKKDNQESVNLFLGKLNEDKEFVSSSIDFKNKLFEKLKNKSPKKLSLINNYPDVLSFLLGIGADGSGSTLIHLVAKLDYTEFLEDDYTKFIEGIFDVIESQEVKKLENVESDMHIKLPSELISIVSSYYASINDYLIVRDNYGRTPVFVALQERNLNLARFLVSKGSILKDHNNNGDTIESLLYVFSSAGYDVSDLYSKIEEEEKEEEKEEKEEKESVFIALVKMILSLIFGVSSIFKNLVYKISS